MTSIVSSWQTDPRLRAVHIVAGLEIAHGGPSYSVPRLCEGLAAAGIDTTLFSVAAQNGAQFTAATARYRNRCFNWDYAGVPVLRRLRASSGLANALRGVASDVEVIHNHGLWLMPNVYAGWEAKRAKTSLIVAPRGMLSPVALTFSRTRKRAFWWLLQGPAFCRAACVHATSIQEYEEVRAFGLNNPVAIIPNGIDLPELQGDAGISPGPERIVLSLGRIHPKKSLDLLIRAWAKVEPTHPGWRLRIVGPDEQGYGGELRSLAARHGLSRVSIEPPIFGNEKLRAYREADLFVLPTSNENFAVTVAESLAAGTPVISTRGAPWSGLARTGCGWWIDQGVDPLAATLVNAMSITRERLKAMGARGREWMARDFSWDRVARDTIAVYRWLSHATEPPETVRFD
jgi:glycosyltransferase involved in cell wall biosynthesis